MRLDSKLILVSLILAIFAAGPTSGFSLGISSDGGSVQKRIEADDGTAYSGGASLGENSIQDSWSASGSGENAIQDRASSGENGRTISMASSGPLKASVSTEVAPDGVASSLNSRMTGDEGSLALFAGSQGNEKQVLAGFLGDGSGEDLSASLSVVAAGRSEIGGNLQVEGVDGMPGAVQGDVVMVLDGLYAQHDGNLGRFGVLAVNREKGSGTPSRGAIPPGTTTYGYYDDPNAWVTPVTDNGKGWLWPSNSNIQFYLKDDKNLAIEGLTTKSASDAVSNAAETWDGKSSQNLFKDGVTVSKSVTADRYDHKNVHAWKYSSSDAIAYSRTWYFTSQSVKGKDGKSYNRAVESDVTYNTRWGWTTDENNPALYNWITNPDSNTYDVQTVALHELGHTLGLGDTYLHSLYKYDLSQIMGYYDAPQRTLGSGDTKGLRSIYGA